MDRESPLKRSKSLEKTWKMNLFIINAKEKKTFFVRGMYSGRRLGKNIVWIGMKRRIAADCVFNEQPSKSCKE